MILLERVTIDFCGVRENKAVVVTVIYFLKVVKMHFKNNRLHNYDAKSKIRLLWAQVLRLDEGLREVSSSRCSLKFCN